MIVIINILSYILCVVAMLLSWSTKRSVNLLYTDQEILLMVRNTWRVWLMSLIIHNFCGFLVMLP